MSLDDGIEEWHTRVLQVMPSFSSLLNRDLLADNMIAVGEEGLQSIIASAEEQDVEYTETDILFAREFAREYVENRIDALSGDSAGNDVEGDVRNPWLDAGIDVATALGIAYLLRRSMRGTNGEEGEWSRKFILGIGTAVSARSVLNTLDNLGKSFANGVIGFVMRFLPVWKTWLETSSLAPRDEHLAIVGETVAYNANFSHGQFWSQESINCKCGIEITFGRRP